MNVQCYVGRCIFICCIKVKKHVHISSFIIRYQKGFMAPGVFFCFCFFFLWETGPNSSLSVKGCRPLVQPDIKIKFKYSPDIQTKNICTLAILLPNKHTHIHKVGKPYMFDCLVIWGSYQGSQSPWWPLAPKPPLHLPQDDSAEPWHGSVLRAPGSSVWWALFHYKLKKMDAGSIHFAWNIHPLMHLWCNEQLGTWTRLNLQFVMEQTWKGCFLKSLSW